MCGVYRSTTLKSKLAFLFFFSGSPNQQNKHTAVIKIMHIKNMSRGMMLFEIDVCLMQEYKIVWLHLFLTFVVCLELNNAAYTHKVVKTVHPTPPSSLRVR